MRIKNLARFTFVLFIILVSLSAVVGQDMMYNDAPMFDDWEDLPPVEERLPLNPKVIPVVDEIGTYGGTLRFADTGERMDEGLRIRHTGLFRYNFSASAYEADLAESWEWSNENRTLTITLTGRSQMVRWR